MTEQEAINIFKGFKLLPKEQRAVDIATKALEKQIPKKPINGLCPNCDSITHTDCGDSFLDYSLDYCPNCGQAIKWE